jgi:hypothetical protein
VEKIILCIKWGNKYSAEYVNNLYSMVKRNITPPFTFVCLTDCSDRLVNSIRALPLPVLGCSEPVRTRGKWRKVALWGESLHGLQGAALFLDLDSIIINNIDSYFQLGKPEDVILERNWAKPLSNLGQTSVFRFQIGSHPEILKTFQDNPQGIADKYSYEQHYITHSTKKIMKFWPRGWTRHFRLHCLGPMPVRMVRPAIIPQGCKIITFPGRPKPEDAQLGKWKPDSPTYQGRLHHLKKTLITRDWGNGRRFLMPVEWIDKYWY